MLPYKYYILFIACFCIGTSLYGQTRHLVRPDATDSNIDTDNENHWIYHNPEIESRDKLFVFLPGTHGWPGLYTRILKAGANLGYHSIGLNYPNSSAINVVCALSLDESCHGRAREEIFDGIDRHNFIDVDQANSISNRLLKLLIYLDNEFPEESWSQYFEGEEIDWDKIILGGHSQGGGHAGFIGKIKSLDRVIMIASMDWMPLANRTAGWVMEEGVTHADRYFALSHERDESINFENLPIFWQDLGIDLMDNTVQVDEVDFIPNDKQLLITDVESVQDSQYHLSVVIDAATPKDENDEAILKPAWEYLIGSTFVSSTSELNDKQEMLIYPNPVSSSLFIRFKENQERQLRIYSDLGERVLEMRSSESLVMVDLSQYPVGLYYLEVISSTGESALSLNRSFIID